MPGVRHLMQGVTELRERAARLLALALRAQEHGQAMVAEELTELASEDLTHVEQIDGHDQWRYRQRTAAH